MSTVPSSDSSPEVELRTQLDAIRFGVQVFDGKAFYADGGKIVRYDAVGDGSLPAPARMESDDAIIRRVLQVISVPGQGGVYDENRRVMQRFRGCLVMERFSSTWVVLTVGIVRFIGSLREAQTFTSKISRPEEDWLTSIEEVNKQAVFDSCMVIAGAEVHDPHSSSAMDGWTFDALSPPANATDAQRREWDAKVAEAKVKFKAWVRTLPEEDEEDEGVWAVFRSDSDSPVRQAPEFDDAVRGIVGPVFIGHTITDGYQGDAPVFVNTARRVRGRPRMQEVDCKVNGFQRETGHG